MMLLRRSLSAASSPFKQVTAVRSFTTTAAIKFDEQEAGKINDNLRSLRKLMNYEGMNKEFVEIHKQLCSLNNCLTELREGTYRPHHHSSFDVIKSAFEHLGKLNGLISEENLAQRNESDSDVKIIEDGGIDVQQLGAMIQAEGRKTRSTIQDEEKKTRSTIQDEERKNRLIDAIRKLGKRDVTYYYDEYKRAYVGPQGEGGTDGKFHVLLRSILRAFLAGDGFDVTNLYDKVKADALFSEKIKGSNNSIATNKYDLYKLLSVDGGKQHLRAKLSAAIADLTGTTPQYKANADNRFMIYHG